MTGQTISHYQVLDQIGEGGMGVVYRAADKHLGRIVALIWKPWISDSALCDDPLLRVDI